MFAPLTSRAYQVCQNFPQIRLSTPTEMVKKATLIAVPAVLLFGVQSLQVADGSYAIFSCSLCGFCWMYTNATCLPPCVACVLFG